MYITSVSNIIKLFLILTLFCALLSKTAYADDGVAKVVYHVDFADPKRFSAMLQNIFNMSNTYENELVEYDIRIVMLSKGIRFATKNNLKGTPFEADKTFVKERENLIKRLTSLRELRGIKLELCKITLDVVQLDKTELIPGIKLVTSGVVQIAKLQNQGFAYLKVE